MTLGCYIASMDRKLAYYSVPISKDKQIRMFSQLFCILFPNVSVQIYSVLRRQGYLSSPYIDESWGLFGNYQCHNRNVYIPWVYHSPNQGNTRPSPEIFRICAWLSSNENVSCTRKEHESYFSLFRALSKQMFYCVSSLESRWEYDMQLPRGHTRTSLLFKFNLYLGERLWSVIDHLQ